MRTIGCGAVLLVGLVSKSACPAAEMQLFKSPDGRFEIRMPGEVVADTSKAADGRETVKYVVNQGTTGYHVMVSDNFVGAEDTIEQQEQRLVAVRTGLLENLAGKVVYDVKFTTPEKYPARNVRIAMKLKGTDLNGGYRGKMFIVGTRFYQVFIVGTPASCDGKDANEFISSFKILNGAPVAVAKPTPNNSAEKPVADKPAGETKLFKSPDGKFEIQSPGEVVTKTNKGDDGSESATYVINYGGGQYCVTTSDKPDNAEETTEQKEERLVAVQTSLLEDLVGTTVYDVKVTTPEGYPARNVRIAMKSKGTDVAGGYRGKMLIVGNRFYQVFVIGTPAVCDGKDANEFISSFKVLSGEPVYFQPPDGLFRVLFPAPPKLHREEAIPYYMAEFDEVSYCVMTAEDFAVGEESLEEHDRRFDIWRDGMLKSLKGKLVENVSIRLKNRFDGRFLRIKFKLDDAAIDALYRARCFCIGDHIYSVYAYGPSEKVDGAKVTEFLDSFSAKY